MYLVYFNVCFCKHTQTKSCIMDNEIKFSVPLNKQLVFGCLCFSLFLLSAVLYIRRPEVVQVSLVCKTYVQKK